PGPGLVDSPNRGGGDAGPDTPGRQVFGALGGRGGSMPPIRRPPMTDTAHKSPSPGSAAVSAIAPKRGAILDLDGELAALAAMSVEDLRERWTSLTGTPAPRVRAGLLGLALAWELQAAVHGGL